MTYARSKKNVLRGIHIQYPNLQGKLISVISGKIFDVIVDVRKNSPTFGRWSSVILDSKKKSNLWIPEGFGHGYLVLSKEADILYSSTKKYFPKNQIDIKWNDPFININWPIKKPILSKKDSKGLELKSIETDLFPTDFENISLNKLKFFIIDPNKFKRSKSAEWRRATREMHVGGKTRRSTNY